MLLDYTSFSQRLARHSSTEQLLPIEKKSPYA
jgi:hypothetical protein